ncbi:MAG: TlpA disulfide reductase family protein [Bacteroidota bacterium]
MKKTLLTILAAVPAFAFAQMPFTVKGKVGTIGAPSKVFLRYVADKKLVMDSTVAVNGEFTFTGTVKDITSATLIYDPAGTGLSKLDRKMKTDIAQVYLSAGTATVTSADSLSKAKVSGTKVNDDNIVYKAYMKPVTDKQAQLSAWYMATPAETRKGKEFQDAYEAKSDVIDKENATLTKAYIKSHPTAYMSVTALTSALGYYPEYADAAAVFNTLSPELKATATGVRYAGLLEKWKKTAIGAMAPEFAQADTSGKMVTLSSFKGKYLLIDFWASWCGPCRAENPNVVSAFNKYKDKNFTILGVSLDQPTGKTKWIDAIKKDGLNWTQVSDLKFWDNEVSSSYGIQAIPQNILLDPNGKIIAKGLRGKDLTDKLEQLFGKI